MEKLGSKNLLQYREVGFKCPRLRSNLVQLLEELKLISCLVYIIINVKLFLNKPSNLKLKQNIIVMMH